ncbi:hypothetical protein JW905_07745, partial [bacterium]|nr:hypothetical protein [candidate division CSSED10-310 bacterium]
MNEKLAALDDRIAWNGGVLVVVCCVLAAGWWFCATTRSAGAGEKAHRLLHDLQVQVDLKERLSADYEELEDKLKGLGAEIAVMKETPADERSLLASMRLERKLARAQQYLDKAGELEARLKTVEEKLLSLRTGVMDEYVSANGYLSAELEELAQRPVEERRGADRERRRELLRDLGFWRQVRLYADSLAPLEGEFAVPVLQV